MGTAAGAAEPRAVGPSETPQGAAVEVVRDADRDEEREAQRPGTCRGNQTPWLATVAPKAVRVLSPMGMRVRR